MRIIAGLLIIMAFTTAATLAQQPTTLWTKFGHSKPVTAIGVSPNGSTVTTGDGAGAIILWNSATHNAENILHDTAGYPITNIAFSGDAKTMITLSTEEDYQSTRNNITFWDFPTGKMILSIPRSGSIKPIHFTRDGGHFFCSINERLQKFDISTGEYKTFFLGQDIDTYSCSPTEDVVACLFRSVKIPGTSYYGCVLRLYNYTTGDSICMPFTYDYSYQTYRFGFTPDGASVIVVGRMSDSVEGILSFDSHTGVQKQYIPFSTYGIKSDDLSLSSDGRYCAITTSENTIKSWDLETGLIHSIIPTLSTVSSVFTSNNNLFFANNFSLNLYTMSNGTVEQVFSGPHDGAIDAVAFSNDGQTVASVGGNSVMVSGVTIAVPTTVMPFAGGHYGALCYSPDNRYLIESGDNIFRWDLQKGVTTDSLPGSYDIHVPSPDFQHRINSWEGSCGMGGGTELYEFAAKKAIKRIDQWGYSLAEIAFSPDSKLVGIGDYYGIRLFNTLTADLEKNFTSQNRIRSIAFSSTGSMILAAYDSIYLTLSSPCIIDASSGVVLSRFEQVPTSISKLFYSASEAFVIGICGDDKIRIWDVATGKVVSSWPYAGSNERIAFSSDLNYQIVAEGGSLIFQRTPFSLSSVATKTTSPAGLNYPNPLIERTTIVLAATSQTSGALELYNAIGARVHSQVIPANVSTITLERNGLSAGAYHYQIIGPTMVLQQGSIVIK